MPSAPRADYWSQPTDALLKQLDSSANGLGSLQAQARLQQRTRQRPLAASANGLLRRLLQALTRPLLLILIFGAVVALAAREWLNAAIVLGIVLLSSLLGAWQEHRAAGAVAALRGRIALRANVLRDGVVLSIAADKVVAGDVLLLKAGSLIPADGRLLDSKDCFVSEALLTGETFPASKQTGSVPAAATLPQRSNCLYAGTSVRSGTATLLAVAVNGDTELGRIAGRLSQQPPETEFERGLRHFGGLLLQVMVAAVLAVLVVNLLLGRPLLETLLFAVALAVGLSPEMLPAIMSVMLARGAQRMAEHGVIVRRLNAIEDLGAMDVLCTDKTGTLTRGVVRLDGALDALGHDSTDVLRRAFLNAALQAGMPNPLDEAIVAAGEARGLSVASATKLDEMPYDFVRKRLSVVVSGTHGARELICKGALDPVLAVCNRVDGDNGEAPLDDDARAAIHRLLEHWSAQGFRVLGVAHKLLDAAADSGREQERELCFAGFLLFQDPPEPGVQQTLASLRTLGVAVKIITGDNRLVARHVAEAVGLGGGREISGAELEDMRDEALWNLAPQTTVFCEVDPNQKERIILALRHSGHVVGYLGDGINDAPALHAADVGVSVDSAADVAREAADLVLLRHDLDVLRQGIEEGRRTFANTLKYVFITSSANFGNMISMALAALFLPFLPLLAGQILLNNFLSDIPALSLAGDQVDAEWQSTPHRWDIGMVRGFMLRFGLISTLFDLLTFAVLLKVAGGAPELFRTGWLVESLLTELLIIFVVRTYRPFYRSRADRGVLLSASAVAATGLALPYLPFVAGWFGLVPLPLTLLATIVGISLLYFSVSEIAKRRFFRSAILPRAVAHH